MMKSLKWQTVRFQNNTNRLNKSNPFLRKLFTYIASHDLDDRIKWIVVATDNFDKRHKDNYKTIKQDVHRVQLLDPACGTGTFLAETIKLIHKKFKNQTGIWNSYVEEHLIPRLHGFELLMASYAMAHIKMDLLLRETGYTLKQQKRFKIFLTNSL